MNCENCQNFLSEFLDGELDNETSAFVRAHLGICAECAEIFEDFASIIGFCSEEKIKEVSPPNSQALWCRISNIIETEIKQEITKQPEPKPSRLSRIWNRRWSLSLTQAVSAVMSVALISSLLTIVGIKNFVPFSDQTARGSVAPSLFERVMFRVGLVESPQAEREKRLKEQQEAIEYWNRRVEARRRQWNKNIREAFDRNLLEIDQVVAEYQQILQQNPDDEISGELLDSAMNDKMELLRQFSDL
jgi:Predicted integral membrane protein